MAHLPHQHHLDVVVTKEVLVKVDVVIATWIVVETCGIGGTPGVMVDLVEAGVTATSGEDLEATEVPNDIIRS